MDKATVVRPRGRHADARHDQAHAPADQGRARPAEGPRVRSPARATQATATIETTRENFPEVLALVAEVLREPVVPAKEFEELQQENLAAIEQQRSEPDALAPNAYQRHMNPYPKGDPRYVDDVRRVARELQGRDARRRRSRSTPISTAPPTASSRSSATSTTRPRPSSSASSSAPGRARPASRACRSPIRTSRPMNKALETPDKANAFFIAGQNLKLRDDDPDYPALVLGNYMLGGGFLNSRLAVAHPPEGRALLRRRVAVPGLSARSSPARSRRSPSTRRRTRPSSRPRSRKRSPAC